MKGENITSDNDGSIKVVNNQDGSVSFIIDETVVTLEDRQNTQVKAHKIQVNQANLNTQNTGESSQTKYTKYR